MKVSVSQNKITITLETDEEKETINDYVAKYGEIAIKDQMQIWLNSRIATHQEVVKADVWTKLTPQERADLKNQVKNRQ